MLCRQTVAIFMCIYIWFDSAHKANSSQFEFNLNVPVSLSLLSFFFCVRLQAMKAFIEANFKSIDIDGDGIIGAKEYRYNCITRIAVESIQVVDDAYNKLTDVNIS